MINSRCFNIGLAGNNFAFIALSQIKTTKTFHDSARCSVVWCCTWSKPLGILKAVNFSSLINVYISFVNQQKLS
ncbi:Hypothetical protein PMT_2675 [Prochlorococcus marinus str. MIT 9313]|uniref:Uncharacterized protein n=1 Tax=Prochlorococcus marinus (strain MIT 9313) TaxID=74547 RepID=B9ES59_PROMM|nr:Hypothetical protein PMT_2675 [Prochlorococcus marinus str. MIT 9313]